MAYHDKKLAPEWNEAADMRDQDDGMDDDRTENRPFRRKAALIAEARRPAMVEPEAVATPAKAEPAPEPAKRQTLPMALPEPWLRLRQTSLGLRLPQKGRMPLVNLFRADPAAKAFDVMRTRLLQTLKAKGWTRIAISAPTEGCGATFTAVNLALSMARVPGSRTVLLDMNMRDPGIAAALDMPAKDDMRGLLRRETSYLDHLFRCGDTLALGLGAGPVRDASELLHSQVAGEVLDEIQEELKPDVILCDMPAVLAHDDLAAFVGSVDGVLLVADGTMTTSEHVRRCEQVLGVDVPLVGVVLNRGREAGQENYVV
ncbi:CpsD/CapB family tyrosine-protein kinase [Ruegeria sp. PrR005]|uniref:CpsD/CapB family tyrosine-protein kinase n=1 Tax=Ruegeria sp. PrR005 TaxID=2706882 RepID=A0A6B2NT20_9RHOB|nr:CpsD/CapB family tyrosine-protein kinase [Ruegeria sp. PrR005]NDW45015.1 CpsD/CapB family tyrosine-protein kinase [Ruegeria sp. PrR005]